MVTLDVRPSAVCVSWDWLAYLASASLVLVYSFETLVVMASAVCWAVLALERASAAVLEAAVTCVWMPAAVCSTLETRSRELAASLAALSALPAVACCSV